MSDSHESRLQQSGLQLSSPPVPAANYVPVVRSGNLVFIAGQVPTKEGKDQYTGKVDRDVTVADAVSAARLCAANVIAQLRAYLGGSLDGVERCVRIGGFINASEDFGGHPAVLNGASDLMVEIFGESGRHVRVAVGCSSLPRDVPVEVEATFELKANFDTSST